MKKRNKKTGDILEYDFVIYRKMTKDGYKDFRPGNNEDWEDVAEEKSKGIQWVDVLGANDGRVVIQYSNEEEAKKAVEKLKAWKRLKDKGFRFTHYHCGTGIIRFEVPDSFFPENDTITDETEKDLDLLFGGKDGN